MKEDHGLDTESEVLSDLPSSPLSLPTSPAPQHVRDSPLTRKQRETTTPRTPRQRYVTLPYRDVLLTTPYRPISVNPTVTPDHSTPLSERQLSSSGPIRSSPVIGTRSQRKIIRRQKSLKRLSQRRSIGKRLSEFSLMETLDAVLHFMKSKSVRFGDLLAYVFDPKQHHGHIHWHEFFVRKGSACQLLNWWTSYHYSPVVRDEISEWAVQHVAGLIRQEATSVVKSKILQTSGVVLNREVVNTFSFLSLHDTLKSEMAPVSMTVLQAMATNPRAKARHTDQRKERTKIIITSAALTCFGEYSHYNNLAKRMLTLYLYSTGAQRQAISVLSSLGLTESYSNLISKNPRRGRQGRPNDSQDIKSTQDTIMAQHAGTLPQLSDSLRAEAQTIASTGLFGIVYDNINMAFRNAEQVLGRHDSQENGTCATLFSLFKANLDDLQVSEFQTSFLKASPLHLEDILLNTDEKQAFEQHILFTILRIIINFGGDGFKKFQPALEKHQPFTKDKIELHRTNIHPLPAWNIDESTVIGNAEVDEAIVEELNLAQVPNFWMRVRLQAGDQLSLARLRSNELLRAGEEDEYRALFFFALVNGLFHAKIADSQGILETHFGKPEAGAQDPGSLAFHNTRLDRLPIVLSSLPSFRTCRDLIFTSLYARILHCLLLVSKIRSLEEYTATVDSWETLVSHAKAIQHDYANPLLIEQLRLQRMKEWSGPSGDTSAPKTGDMVFENACLFLRDTLISREFTDAVKAGDSGRVFLVLKVWAFSFRGSGRTKYAHEMLHTIHNLTKVYPEALRAIVMNNWLVNPSGKPNSFVELDLLQEHLNYWIKTFYKAHGSNASWEWLEHIAPCVDVLRSLANNFHKTLGSDQGTKHADPNLANDIQSLMDSLDNYNVYRLSEGRILKGGGAPVPDVVSVGLRNVAIPLRDYNINFHRLQERRKSPPVTIDSVNAATLPTRNQPPWTESTQGALSIGSDFDENATSMFPEDAELAMATTREDSELLPRLSIEDVSLDMDAVEVEPSDDSSGDSEDMEFEDLVDNEV